MLTSIFLRASSSFELSTLSYKHDRKSVCGQNFMKAACRTSRQYFSRGFLGSTHQMDRRHLLLLDHQLHELFVLDVDAIQKTGDTHRRC